MLPVLLRAAREGMAVLREATVVLVVLGVLLAASTVVPLLVNMVVLPQDRVAMADLLAVDPLVVDMVNRAATPRNKAAILLSKVAMAAPLRLDTRREAIPLCRW